jgi:hypothetical protein
MGRMFRAHRIGVLVAAVVLVGLIGGVAAAQIARQVRVAEKAVILGVPNLKMQLPTERLNQVKQGKQHANIALLQQSYLLRNNVPIIRGADGAEFELIPLEKMAYDPTEAEIRVSSALLGPLARHKAYIFKDPGAVVSVLGVVDHRPDQTSVKNQAGRGTCVCFASLAGLEVAYGGGSLDLSENYANYLYMHAQGRGCKDAGLKTTDSADYLSANGVCRESVCPYQTSFPAWCNNGANPAPAKRTAGAGADPYKITSFQKIWRNDSLSTDTGLWINNPSYLESILNSGKDIVFGTHIAGWTSPYTGVIDVKLGPGGDPLPSVGGHAMLIVGYNRPGGYFIVKNSWGTSRGQNGYVYLSYDYIRTYAKYGYVINGVQPLVMPFPVILKQMQPVNPIDPVLQVQPKVTPRIQKVR